MALEDTIIIARGLRLFSVRVVVAVIHDGRVLLQTFSDPPDHWVLPGGRGEMMEPMIEGAAREMREELGEDVHLDRLLWVVDSFFRFGNADHHEIGLYWLASLQPSSPLPRQESFSGEEAGGARFTCRWHNIDSLGGIRLLPSFLTDGLAALPASPRYLVHRDDPPSAA